MTGTKTTTTHAPCENFSTAMIPVTTSVVTAPRPLMTSPRRQPGSRNRTKRINVRNIRFLLRYDGTVQLTSRFATSDVTFGDAFIPAGEGVFIILGAANRDPERYPDPDRIDFTRERIQPAFALARCALVRD